MRLGLFAEAHLDMHLLIKLLGQPVET